MISGAGAADEASWFVDSQAAARLRPAAPTVPSPIDPDRRIDWRFTIPEARLGAVAVLGDLDPPLLSALTRSAELLMIDGGDLDTGRFDTVVVRNPSVHQLDRAWRLLAPGGHLHAELARGRSREGVTARLRSGGWDPVASYWHRGGFEDARAIVRLDNLRAAALVLQRQGGGPGARLAVAAVRLGLPRWLADAVTVLARRPVPGESTPTMPAGDEVSVWLTPHFRASRHVIGLGADADGSRLTTVVKIPRAASDSVVSHEAACLQRFEASSIDPDRAPRLVVLSDRGERPILIETAVNGRPLDRRRVRRDRAAAVQAGVDWLTAVPCGRPSPIEGDGRWSRLVDGPARRLTAAPGPRQPHLRDLVDRSLKVLEPLRTGNVPTVFEHGDFSHPNLIVIDDGRLAAVDWEKAEPQGLPAHDLSFFIAYLCTATEKSVASAVDGYRTALSGPGWGRVVVAGYLERVGVAPGLAAPLQVASWLRTTAALADVPGALDGVDAHRWERFWQVAVAGAEAEMHGRARIDTGEQHR